jgi:hypothetical protein
MTIADVTGCVLIVIGVAWFVFTSWAAWVKTHESTMTEKAGIPAVGLWIASVGIVLIWFY